ncbi:MAG: hypothetical protein ACYTG1_04055 [Planctomycetota bacterium]|jgi:hypothetical protein
MTASSSARARLDGLSAVRTQFGRGAGRRKLERLAAMESVRLRDPRIVRDYHRVLLFLAAYPDDPRVLAAADAELRRVAAAAEELADRPSAAAILDDTGIAGTAVESSFTIDTVDWLVRRFPDDVDVAWDEESAGSALDEFLAHCVAHVEGDGLISSDLTTQGWVRLARGDHGSDLAWLVDRFRRLRCDSGILDHVFDGLELPVRWRLADPRATTTFTRFPARSVFFRSRRPGRRVAAARLVARPLPAARVVSPGAARTLVEAARCTLLVRKRETDPVTYANPREVTLVSLDRGLDVALYGMTPSRRLPIESFFGYVAAMNRVPVAYGGGWVFGDQSEIGINVFEPFRGGESAWLFAQILHVYRQHYGVRRFLVDPFQFGRGNEEGIRSGAFWFYYRLGFRPTEPALARVAREEWTRIRADRAYRTAAATLRRLATSNLAADFRPRGERGPALHLPSLSLAVTGAIGARFGGDRERAAAWARRRVTRALGVGRAPGWSPEERRAFDRLSLLVALVPDLEDWSGPQKRALAAALRAKGGPRERTYVQRVRRHARLRAALREVARAGAAV